MANKNLGKRSASFLEKIRSEQEKCQVKLEETPVELYIGHDIEIRKTVLKELNSALKVNGLVASVDHRHTDKEIHPYAIYDSYLVISKKDK